MRMAVLLSPFLRAIITNLTCAMSLLRTAAWSGCQATDIKALLQGGSATISRAASGFTHGSTGPLKSIVAYAVWRCGVDFLGIPEGIVALQPLVMTDINREKFALAVRLFVWGALEIGTDIGDFAALRKVPNESNLKRCRDGL